MSETENLATKALDDLQSTIDWYKGYWEQKEVMSAVLAKELNITKDEANRFIWELSLLSTNREILSLLKEFVNQSNSGLEKLAQTIKESFKHLPRDDDEPWK